MTEIKPVAVEQRDAIDFCNEAFRNTDWIDTIDRELLEDVQGALATFVRRRASLQPAPSDAGLREALDTLSNLSSYLGAGLGDDATTAEQFDARIRWGIDHMVTSVIRHCASVVEECSKRPNTRWGEVKKRILDLAPQYEASETAVRAALQSSPSLDGDQGHDQMECHGLDTPERVCFYEQDFYVLSNFSSFQIVWEGLTFQTSEQLYHYLKFATSPDGESANVSVANDIWYASSAHAAFKIAELNRGFRRSDWDAVKVGFMRDILRLKTGQHEYVRRKLLATGSRELVENSWRDDFWGWGPNRDGQNMLGKLWMEIRAELRNNEQAGVRHD